MPVNIDSFVKVGLSPNFFVIVLLARLNHIFISDIVSGLFLFVSTPRIILPWAKRKIFLRNTKRDKEDNHVAKVIENIYGSFMLVQ